MLMGTDWGAYLGPTGQVQLPFVEMIEKIHLAIFMCKGGQEVDMPGKKLSTKKCLAAARAAGVPIVGTYYWNDPLVSAANQIDNFSRLIDAEQPDVAGLDVEQWWASWSRYEEALAGLRPWSEVPVKSSFSISENAKFVYRGLRERFPNKRILLYTSWNFVTEHSPLLSSWIGEVKDRWVASWPDYGQKVHYVTWEELLAYPGEGVKPALPAPWSSWTMWQTSSRMKPQECMGTQYDHQYDWNLLNFDTVGEALDWAGLRPPVVGEPPPDALARLWAAHPELW